MGSSCDRAKRRRQGPVDSTAAVVDADANGDGVGSADLDRSTKRRSARFLRGGETTDMAVDGR